MLLNRTRSVTGTPSVTRIRLVTGSTEGKTTNFAYSQGTAKSADWQASSIVGLNDCTIGTVWKIGSDYSNSTGNVTAKADFAAGPNSSGCTIAGLTPNFCKIGNTTAGSGCN